MYSVVFSVAPLALGDFNKNYGKKLILDATVRGYSKNSKYQSDIKNRTFIKIHLVGKNNKLPVFYHETINDKNLF